MDYVVGSVAALISGNVTPNRPKLVRRALTPTKHQPSPNVTPKSEFVVDRSIFLSPTQQKKKAIVKKSPKRIFQNPDLDVTEGCEGNSSLTSPKAEKVKKHLKEELEAENMGKKKLKSPCSALEMSSDDVSPTINSTIDNNISVTNGTPKKKKKKRNSESKELEENENATTESVAISETIDDNSKSSQKKQRKSKIDSQDTPTTENVNESGSKSEFKKNKKQKKKNKKPQQNVESLQDNETSTEKNTEQSPSKKKKKNRKNKIKNTTEATNLERPQEEEEKMEVENSESESEEVKSKNIPNPNAITEKDSDSEHDSDDEIESDNEEANKKVLTNEDVPQESSDEEEESKPSNKKQKEKNKEEKGQHVMTEDEVKRTLFVGNVPFSKKCKKEIKKIFSKYGQIETIRIRTIPVKDARMTPKLAVIKSELHPERSTVNVYIKYADTASVGKAIAENNTVLNGNHLRVSRSDSTGSEHDPQRAVFVGNLPFAIEDDVLRSKFDKCGEIQSVRIIRDRKTNAGKGFGYINFASKDGVELALALSEEDLTIKNRILRVKRCTLTQGKPGKQGSQGKPGFHGGRQENQGGRPAFQGGRQSNQRGRPGFQRGRQNNQGARQRNQEGRPGSQGGRQGNQEGGGKWGQQGGRPGNQEGGGKWGQQGGKWGEQGPEGAARRLMNKRKFQESGEGPPNKRQHVNQPVKEKKPRKEFVGMTADKKKKQKFDKGQKKKKALSEILTKST